MGKAKVAKDCGQISNEIGDVRAATDEVARSKASAEKSHRALLANLNNLTKRVEEANLVLGDFESSKRRITAENADLLRQVQELNANASLMVKTKSALIAALDEQKMIADNVAKERVSLLGKYRNLEHASDGLRDNYDEEVASKENLARQLSKALGDADMWKQKYEIDGMAKAEELEMGNLKLQARLSEGQGVTEQLSLKLAQLEKAKAKITADAADMAQQLDQAQILNAAMEKKAKQFDRIVAEWKAKVDGLVMDLDVAQMETRNISSDLFKVKSAYDESILQLEEVRRENKMLSNEIKDIMDQISEVGRSIHEIDKIRKRLEAEKMELEAALSEAEGALEQEENKVLRAQLELTQVRQEIERSLAEKEEEFENSRKNHARAMDSMQASLEAEQRAKAEALRIKKKLEGDINELEIALDHANKANSEAQKAIKRYQGQHREAECAYEEEQRQRQEVVERVTLADRRANALAGEMEEARSLLDSAERGKRQTEAELSESRAAVNEMASINSRASGEKRSLEGAVHTMHAEIDDMVHNAKNSEEKAKKAMVDAARLADELRAEQDHVNTQSKAKRALETQLVELENKLAEANENAIRGGREAMAKLESRIRELEIELGNMQAHTGDNSKAFQKSERRAKELVFQIDEDKKNQDHMSELATKLQQKIKTYKKQIEEAEEIAALNLAKFRKAQQELEETEERAKLAEAQIQF